MKDMKNFTLPFISSLFLMLFTYQASCLSPRGGRFNVEKDPFLKAISEGQLEAVKEFVSKGRDIEKKVTYAEDFRLSSPLHYAVYYSQLAIVKYFIEQGANVNKKNNDNETPLFHAKQADIVECLIKNGADVHVRNRDKLTLLHVVYNPEVAKLIIEAGADIEATRSAANTPIKYAVNAVRVGVVKVLLDAGAHIDINADGSAFILEQAKLGKRSAERRSSSKEFIERHTEIIKILEEAIVKRKAEKEKKN